MQDEKPEDLAEPDIEAELLEEDRRIAAGMRAAGIDDDTISRTRGRTLVELFPAPPPSLQEIEKELRDIEELRRTDKRAYWKNAEVQAREVALLEQRQKLTATKPTPEKAAPAKAEKPADDAKADEDDILDADSLPLPKALRDAWSKSPGGIAEAVEAIRSRTRPLMATLGEESNDLLESFDALDGEAQEAIIGTIAEDAGRWPVASEADVEQFRAVGEYGPALLEEWGRDAPKLLGRARAEAEAMLAVMSAPARTRVEAWIAGLSPRQKTAVIKTLAERPRRKL